MKEAIEKAIKELANKSAKCSSGTQSALEAMQYAQAALNLAQTLGSLGLDKK